MKHWLVLALFTIVLGFTYCSKEGFSSDERKFIKTYKEILIARYSIADSVKANQEVMNILKRNGYSFREFLDTFWELRNKDSKRFSAIIDSIRKSAVQDVIEAKKKEFQRANR
jgi:hypothetical protein